MGNVATYKLRFSNLVRAYLAASKTRQGSLALAMGVTDSAVSQIISGKIIPSIEQIAVMVRMLKLTREQEMELKVLIARIRFGGEILRTKLNEFLIGKRLAKKLSYSQVARATKIPVARVRLFENSLELEPTLEEAKKLGDLLGFTVEDVIKNSFDGTIESEQEACESAASYGGNKLETMPELNLELLNEYRYKQSICAFAQRHQLKRVLRPEWLPKGVCLVRTSGRELGMAWRGEVRLYLFNEFGPGAQKIVLGKDEAGCFRLCEHRDGGYCTLQFGEEKVQPVKLGSSIPVLAVMLEPAAEARA